MIGRRMGRKTTASRLPGLLGGSRLRRQQVLGIYGLLLVAASVTTGFLAWRVFPWPEADAGTADRLAETADVLTAGTLVLAILAALVALQAYAAATGLPDLQVQVTFGFSYPNRPVFRATSGDDGNSQVVAPFKQVYCIVKVRNKSGYSARNPAVIIRLKGMAFYPPDRTKWTDIDFAQTQGTTAMQWDGGVQSIHGYSSRRLPGLNFTGLHTVPVWGEPAFVVELLAEGGYRKEREIAVRFIPGDSAWETNVPVSERPSEWL
jgi:hypothetical protein